MLAHHSHQLLKSAATESLERIRQDRARVPQRLKPLLAYIEEHLFDPTLDVNQLKRSCGVRDNSVPIQFHSAVGRPPHGYIEDRRLETACRLLADTDLKIWQISELLGYSSIQVFSRAFSRWSGQRPTLYRKKARRRVGKEPKVTKPNVEDVFHPDSLRRALAGELPPQEATVLIERLFRLYPSCRKTFERAAATGDLDHDPGSDDDDGGLYMAAGASAGAAAGGRESPLSIRLSGREIEKLRAEEIVKELERHPADKQLALLAELSPASTTLFHLLRERSLEVGREDPARGVRLAELALRSLDALEEEVTDEALADLRSRGWLSLATARCYAADFTAAEACFAEAERHFELGSRDLELEADIALHQASLRRDQRRFEEARGLVDRARALFRRLGREDRVDRALIVRATVAYEEGEPAAAIPYLQTVKERLTESTDDLVKLSLYHNLATAYAESGRYQEAMELLPRARRLTLAYGKASHKIRLRWLEGVIFRELERYTAAETAFLEARDTFIEVEDPVSAALVCLDLAELYRRQGRTAELAELSASMVQLFSHLQQHREALVSMQLLQQAAEARQVTEALLRQTRSNLQGNRRRLA
jgi:AraC-like DNA-binding protein/tetratricopeptide (TPR) repeat protein